MVAGNTGKKRNKTVPEIARYSIQLEKPDIKKLKHIAVDRELTDKECVQKMVLEKIQEEFEKLFQT